MGVLLFITSPFQPHCYANGVTFGEPLRWGLVARGANLRIRELEVSKHYPFGFL